MEIRTNLSALSRNIFITIVNNNSCEYRSMVLNDSIFTGEDID